VSAFMHEPEHLRVLVWAGLSTRPHAGESELSWPVPEGAYTVAEAADPCSGLETSRWGARRALHPGSADAVMGMLAAASVWTRYQDADDMVEGLDRYTYARPQDTGWTDAEVWHALRSFDYQACEVEGWRDTEARRFLDALEYRLVSRMAGREVGDAWSIDDTSSSGYTARTAALRADR
jgi:hypothetical protein